MRTAGLPTFSKLALRNPDEVMKAGTYQIDIDLSNSSTPATRNVKSAFAFLQISFLLRVVVLVSLGV